MKLRFLYVLGLITLSLSAQANDQVVVDKLIESVSSCNLSKLKKVLSSHEIDLNLKLQHSKHSDSFYILDILNSNKCFRKHETKPISYGDKIESSIKKVLSEYGATITEYNSKFKRIDEINDTQLFDSFRTCDYEKVRAVVNKNPKLVNVADSKGYTPLARIQNVNCKTTSSKMYEFSYKVTKLLIDSGADTNQYSSIKPTTWVITQGPWFFNVLNVKKIGKESLIYLTKLINEFSLNTSLLDMQGASVLPYIQLISNDYQANLDFVKEFNIDVNQYDFQGYYYGVYLPFTLHLNKDENIDLLLKYYSRFKYKSTFNIGGGVLASLLANIYFDMNNDNVDKYFVFLARFIEQHPSILNAKSLETGETSLMKSLYFLCPRVKGDDFIYYDNFLADKKVPRKMYDWLFTILESNLVDYSKVDNRGNSYFHYAIHLCPSKVSSSILSKTRVIPNVVDSIEKDIEFTKFFDDQTIFQLEERNSVRFLNGDKENLKVLSEVVSKEKLKMLSDTFYKEK